MVLNKTKQKQKQLTLTLKLLNVKAIFKFPLHAQFILKDPFILFFIRDHAKSLDWYLERSTQAVFVIVKSHKFLLVHLFRIGS